MTEGSKCVLLPWRNVQLRWDALVAETAALKWCRSPTRRRSPHASCSSDRSFRGPEIRVATVQRGRDGLGSWSLYHRFLRRTCQSRGLNLVVLPPKRPQLNGHVERAQGSWRYEFYAAYDLPRRLDRLQTPRRRLHPPLQ